MTVIMVYGLINTWIIMTVIVVYDLINTWIIMTVIVVYDLINTWIIMTVIVVHSLSLGPHRESDGWKDRVVVCCVGDTHSVWLCDKANTVVWRGVDGLHMLNQNRHH